MALQFSPLQAEPLPTEDTTKPSDVLDTKKPLKAERDNSTAGVVDGAIDNLSEPAFIIPTSFEDGEASDPSLSHLLHPNDPGHPDATEI